MVKSLMICINTDDSALDDLQEQVLKVMTSYKHLNSVIHQLKGTPANEKTHDTPVAPNI